MNNLLKNLGILMILLGTVILVFSFIFNWGDYNWVQATALVVMIIGLIVHIVLNKKYID